MKFSDIISLAKSGWTLKDIKEALELAETSPEVQEADVEALKNNDGVEQPAPAEENKIVEIPQKQEQQEENGESVLDKLF